MSFIFYETLILSTLPLRSILTTQSNSNNPSTFPSNKRQQKMPIITITKIYRKANVSRNQPLILPEAIVSIKRIDKKRIHNHGNLVTQILICCPREIPEIIEKNGLWARAFSFYKLSVIWLT